MQKINYHSDAIPVKPYVKKFIENGNRIKPYILNAIYTLFSKQQGLDADVNLSEYNCFIKFPLPEKVFYQKGFMLTRQNTVVFNTLLEGYIKDRFECELEANIRRSVKEKVKFSFREMVMDLCVEFQFSEEDFPYESIKKSLQRYCEREGVDIQCIKIYNKSVRLAKPKITTNHHHMPSIDFRRQLHIHANTYTRWKKRGIIITYRGAKCDMVDLQQSQLPAPYVVSTLYTN